MDLDISSYSTDELIDALGVSIPKVNLTFLELKKCVDKKLSRIAEIDEYSLSYAGEKKDLISFFQEAFFRIISDIELLPDGSGSSSDTKQHIYTDNNLHINHRPIQTFPSNISTGVINPLIRKSFKQLININSKFRSNYQTSKSSDFTIELPYPIKKVISLKLQNIILPKTNYTFSKNIGSNYFRIDVGNGEKLVEIPDGSYPFHSNTKALNIATTIENSLQSNNINDISVNVNPSSLKTTFKRTGTLTDFSLNFNYIEDKCPYNSNLYDPNQFTLGWLLGFRGDSIKKPEATLQIDKKRDYIQFSSKCCAPPYGYDYKYPSITYDGSNNYISEGMFAGHGTPYFLLSVDDFNNNHSDVIISPFKDQSLTDRNVIAKIPSGYSGQHSLNQNANTEVERIYFGPVELRKLRIRLLDEFARNVENNNDDYSFTLEIQVLYDQ